jgi:hypothetical protein
MPARLTSLSCVVSLLALAGGGAHAQIVDFTDIGVHGTGTPTYDYCSADGSVALSARTGGRQFRWSASAGFEEVISPATVVAIPATSSRLSDDGNRIWAPASSQQDGRKMTVIWTFPGGATAIHENPPPGSVECSLSGGRTNVELVLQDRSGDFAYGVRKFYLTGEPGFGDGCVSNALVRMEAGGAITLYPSTGAAESFFPEAILGDGNVLLSRLDEVSRLSQYVFGPPQGPFQVHPVSAFIEESGLFLTNISEDGTAFFFADLSTDQRSLIRWTEATGPVPIEPNLVRPTPSASGSLDVASPDGTVLIGSYFNSEAFTTEGFYWSEATGFVDLVDYLTENGFDVPYTRILPHSVSNDGRIVYARGERPDASPVNRSIQITMPPPLVDTDGDGLPDEWEREGGGIDSNDDGEIDLSLHELGARPNRKDLFLEIDSTRDFLVSDTAVAMLVEAFANAPVSNPDGSTGITLHIERSDVGIASPAVVPLTDQLEEGVITWPENFFEIQRDYIGSADERTDDNAPHILAARQRVFRYCIVYGKTDGGEGGAAARVHTDVFYICMGYMRASVLAGNATQEDVDIDAAALIMHELGHALGLDHGGVDDINGKPNYPSIMNYSLNHRSEWNKDFWRLDYSRTALVPLFENNIDETIGIDGGPEYSNFHMIATYGFLFDGIVERGITRIQLNGSPIDLGRPEIPNNLTIDGSITPGVIQDLNYDGSEEGLGYMSQPSLGDVMTRNLRATSSSCLIFAHCLVTPSDRSV